MLVVAGSNKRGRRQDGGQRDWPLANGAERLTTVCGDAMAPGRLLIDGVCVARALTVDTTKA